MLDAPMFPDFSVTEADTDKWYMHALEEAPPGMRHFRVETCTLRPPVFNGRGQTFAFYLVASAAFTDEEVRAHARDELMRKYLKAHPENCAGVDA